MPETRVMSPKFLEHLRGDGRSVDRFSCKRFVTTGDAPEIAAGTKGESSTDEGAGDRGSRYSEPSAEAVHVNILALPRKIAEKERFCNRTYTF